SHRPGWPHRERLHAAHHQQGRARQDLRVVHQQRCAVEARDREFPSVRGRRRSAHRAGHRECRTRNGTRPRRSGFRGQRAGHRAAATRGSAVLRANLAMNAATAWYRQPVLWLAIALPALILVALASTLAIALAGSSDAAPEPVQRTADSQVSDLAPDARAQQLGLLATLQLTPDGHDVRVVVRPAPTADIDTLTLQWVHPIQAAKDVEVSLRRDGDGWR